MVTNASTPGKYKPKKNTSGVATNAQAAPDVQGMDNKADEEGSEKAAETGVKTSK